RHQAPVGRRVVLRYRPMGQRAVLRLGGHALYLGVSSIRFVTAAVPAGATGSAMQLLADLLKDVAVRSTSGCASAQIWSFGHGHAPGTATVPQLRQSQRILASVALTAAPRAWAGAELAPACAAASPDGSLRRGRTTQAPASGLPRARGRRYRTVADDVAGLDQARGPALSGHLDDRADVATDLERQGDLRLGLEAAAVPHRAPRPRGCDLRD